MQQVQFVLGKNETLVNFVKRVQSKQRNYPYLKKVLFFLKFQEENVLLT